MTNEPNTVTIGPNQYPIVLYHNRRVVTTEMLAQVFDTEIVRIQQNHARNKERFEEGKHFFKLEGAALKEFVTILKIVANPSMARSLILWTERGAARHAKMLDTEQAWDMFEKLEDCYFKTEPTPEPADAPKTKAMPIPEHAIAQAIERRALALSLGQHEKIKAHLRAAITQRGQELQGQQLLDYIESLEMPDNPYVIAHHATLFQLTSCLVYLDIAQKKALESIHALEQEIGMHLYDRKQPVRCA